MWCFVSWGKENLAFPISRTEEGIYMCSVLHSQLLMLCIGARLRASFSFFSEFLFIFVFTVIFSIPFSIHFQACQVKSISFRFWVFFLLDSGFLNRSDTHRSLLVPQVCIPDLCCEASGLLVGAKGTFVPLPPASPSHPSGSNHLGCLEGCIALSSPCDIDPFIVTHKGWIQKANHVC